MHRSRWLNAVSAMLEAEQVESLRRLPWVRGLRPVARYVGGPAELACTPVGGDSPEVQLQMLGLDSLHRLGFEGAGIRIAVFDNGFDKVGQLPGFAHLFEGGQILATRDYVDGDGEVFAPCVHCRHGTYVFSILAARDARGLSGSAPGASYILLRTEDDNSETPREEDNWVAAAEFADSLGAHIFTTSLGYRFFDPGFPDYSPADLDGNTAIITRAADLAASKGILVVNSAGNSGAAGLNAPADGDSVLAIASVDGCGEYSSFSSQGPRVDGRIKPDLAARGESTYFLHSDGSLRQGNGTSFSCPLISGMAACLWQARPGASAADLADALRRSAHQASSPDSLLGYGIPQVRGTLGLLASLESPRAYPNPATQVLTVELPAAPGGWELGLFDLQGRNLGAAVRWTGPGRAELQMPAGLAGGIYAWRALSASGQKAGGKVIVRP
jgi:subtilisin family serine protease